MGSNETIERLRQACQTTDPKWAKTWKDISNIYELYYKECTQLPENGDEELTHLFSSVHKDLLESLDAMAERLRLEEQAEKDATKSQE
jgi:hypothetical protein